MAISLHSPQPMKTTRSMQKARPSDAGGGGPGDFPGKARWLLEARLVG